MVVSFGYAHWFERKGLLLSRILQVEESLQGYSDADLTAARRSEVDAVLLANVPLEQLRRIETFRPIAQQHDLELLMAARPARRWR